MYKKDFVNREAVIAVGLGDHAKNNGISPKKWRSRENFKYALLMIAGLAICSMACKNGGSGHKETTNQSGGSSWTKKENVPGGGRLLAVGFSIGDKGYVGTGDNGTGAVGKKDFWVYDPSSNVWMQKADFAGGDRESAVGFSIGNKGYVGTGRRYNGNMLNYNDCQDFWEYDPATDKWTQKADFPGGVRFGAVGFSIGNKGYIGTGNDGGAIGEREKNDFWEYDPATDKWTKKADFPGGNRIGAVGFSIGNKGYIGTGVIWNKNDLRNDYKQDFWEYDPATNSWTKKADFAGEARAHAVGFSIGNRGYIGAGSGESGFTGEKNIWEYDPASNKWTKKADMTVGRTSAVSFSIGNKGYIGTGAGTGGGQDFLEFTP